MLENPQDDYGIETTWELRERSTTGKYEDGKVRQFLAYFKPKSQTRFNDMLFTRMLCRLLQVVGHTQAISFTMFRIAYFQ